MENTIISDLLVANEELLAAYEGLTQSEREMNNLCAIMNDIQGAVETVSEIGLDPEIKAILNRDEALENLCGLPLAQITADKAMEGLKEAISEGAQKVWEGIKVVIAKIIEFFGKLFNTTNYQISQILENPMRINFEKVVMTSTKDRIGALAQDCSELQKFVQKFINVQKVKFSSMQEELAVLLAKANVLKQETNSRNEWTGYVEINPQLQFFEQMALKDTGFSINDITGICWRFRDRAKSYTYIGEKLKVVGNDFTAAMKAGQIQDENRYAELFGQGGNVRDMISGIIIAYRMDASAYATIAKLQSYISKQINAFYKAMEETAVAGVNKEEEDKPHVNEISYSA